MKTISVILCSLLLFGSGVIVNHEVEAAIGGKKVIYIHGLRPSHISAKRGTVTDADLLNTSIKEAGVSAKYFDYHFYYPSYERLNGPIASKMFRHLKKAEARGICAQGCIIVTMSTGDLVARYMLQNLDNWGIDRKKFKILGVFDAVGAGGGTEIADLAVNVLTHRNLLSWAARRALSSSFGSSFSGSSPAGLGVLNDLRPTIARSHAKLNTPYPHLKVVGGGDQKKLLGISLADPFISGTDDGVVPLHSACGARYKESIDSCSNSIRIDGRVASANGPSWGYFHNQFPILMMKDMSHNQIWEAERVGTAAPVDRNMSDRSMSGYRLRLNQRERTTGRRWWKKTYRYIDYNQSRPISDTLFNAVRR